MIKGLQPIVNKKMLSTRKEWQEIICMFLFLINPQLRYCVPNMFLYNECKKKYIYSVLGKQCLHKPKYVRSFPIKEYFVFEFNCSAWLATKDIILLKEKKGF